MSKSTKTITQAVLDYLATTLLVGDNVECRRAYLPVADVEELELLGKPLVVVCPVDRKAEPVNRGNTLRQQWSIDIAVNAKLKHRNDLSSLLTDEIDELIGLLEKIHDSFIHCVIGGNGNETRIVCTQPKHLIFCDMEMIMEYNCFLGVVRASVE
ncbi:MAG: hypothetical protein LBQ66_00355 [Planctomycetaceae bacterium]|nr:hypothetical protein [Planctomycetaceae bacterium]